MIVNPRSGRGLNEATWARVRGALIDGLGELDSAFTAAPRDAAAIARREAEAGRRLIVALGGDGTISEVANGILEAGAGTRTELGIIPPDVTEAAKRIREGGARAMDVGRVHFRGHAGQTLIHHFVNVASFGFSSTVATRANASSKRFGGRLAFFGATLRVLASYDNTDVWLTIHDRPRERRRVLMAAIGNGRFFGGGMKICPDARIDDGALDLVTVGDFSKGEVLTNIGRLYEGTHIELEAVDSARVTRVAVEPVEPDTRIPLELDGETPGYLPAVFEIVPAALRLRL